MKYIDLHCDTLTKSLDEKLSLKDGGLQINLNKLKKSGCAAQCLAIFTEGEGADGRFKAYAAYFEECMRRYGKELTFIKSYSDLKYCLDGGGKGVILTVENLGFIRSTDEIDGLYSLGVKMASPVWNYENALAFPNLLFKNGLPLFEEREERGLKKFGREVIEKLDEKGIIVDISHLSDGGAEDILKNRKTPIVASHSNCVAVCNVARNLTDGLIKKIADCGGVVGVNFCKDFLGSGNSFGRVLDNIKHLINIGGEDIIAFGSDFDGIPECEDLESCEKMPALISFLEKGGIQSATLEKLCYKNFARVFKEVCG
ncbi:MAG: membrane dipeptidase [Clostridia bacterium]|nr:membrane dipeptidase [Clostridia bacterium]